MKILMIVNSIDVSKGGPSYAVTNLCQFLYRNAVDITLFTTKAHGNVPVRGEQGFAVEYFEPSFPRRFNNSNDLVRAIRDRGKNFDLIHINTLWNFITTRAARTAKDLGIPYIITPRGMLSAWKPKLCNFHKLIYFSLVERKTIQGASLIHFLTDIEAKSSSRFCRGSPESIIPNGIWPEEFQGLRQDDFRKRFNLNNNRVVIFLGRLCRIKRLDLQCKAFSILAERFPDLKWVFVGPDDGEAGNIRSYMRDAGLSNRTVLTGLLSGNERLSAIAAATVYCHTSDHEGNSVAIMEALAVGKPCVITKGCHFDEIENLEAGRVVEPVAEEIATAIEEILFNPKRARIMSENARYLAFRKYNWDIIAKQMIDVYAWVLGLGEKPDCVRLV